MKQSASIARARNVRIAAAAFALVVIGACAPSVTTDQNGNGYISKVGLTYVVTSGLAGSGSHQQSRAKAQTSLAGVYGLASSTPLLPFVGNPQVVATPLSADRTAFGSAILQRAANCSLTETVFQRVNGRLDPTSSIDLPDAQDYLHRIAGLTTQAGVFPRGCVDSPRGKRSVDTALPISVTPTTIRFADLNQSSEQLEIRTVDRTTGAIAVATLTPGRVKYFAIVDMNGDGLADIVASGVGYGSGNSGNVVVFLNNGDGTYRTATTLANAGSAFVVDDFNGDGKPDVVIDNGSDSNGTQVPGVTTLLGNGDGTFAPALVSATTVARVAGPFVTGDFNGDGKPDLLIGTGVLLGVGDGTFVEGPALPASVQNEIGFNGAVGDFDRDGRLDAVYTGFGYVQILRGNGDGSFTPGARYASLSPVQGVTVSEIDGDGNLDIVVGNAGLGFFLGTVGDPLFERFQVLLGRGDGTFVGAPVFGAAFQTNSSAPQIAVADFDGDGRVDALVIDNTTTNGIDVLPGDGRGAFGAAVRSATTARLSMVAAVDLNGDGKPDVVAAGTDANALPVVVTLINQGGNRVAGEHDYPLPNYPTAIAVGDFDGDGRMDVAVALGTSLYSSTGPNGVYVLYGQADGTLSAPVLVDSSPAVISLATADLNGDGRTDLAVADAGTSSAAGGLHLYLGRADRTFAPITVPTTAATRYTAVAFADLDGDGKQDLVAAGSVPGTSFGSIVPNLYTFLGNGDGTVRAPLTVTLAGTDGNGANTIAVGDLNHDGKLDVVVGNQADYTEVFLGQGDGTYTHALLTLGQQPATIVAVDLDNDRYADLLIGSAGVGMAVLKNAGTVAAWSAPAATTPSSPPATGDFTLSVSPTSGSVVAGQSVQTIVSAMPTADFGSQTMTFACSGLPAGATCTFSPASLTVDAGAAGSSSLTIATRAATALGAIDGGFGWPAGLVVTAFGSVSLVRRRRGSRWPRLLALLAVAAVLASCHGDGGGGSAGSAPATATSPPGTTTTVTITATAASASHTTTYALTLH